MKTLRFFAAVAAGVILHTAASADAGSANLTLDPVTTLSGGAATRTSGSVGYWLTGNTFEGTALVVHDELGPQESWGYQRYTSATLDPAASAGGPFGQHDVRLTQTDAGYPMLAESHIGTNTLSAAWQRSSLQQDYALGSVYWNRYFVLDPFASITFSASASYSNPAGATEARFGEQEGDGYRVVHQAGLGLYVPGTYGGDVTLALQTLNVDPTGPSDVYLGRFADDRDFTYSYDSFGHLALTVHNLSADPLFANFLAQISAVASPVPEPAAWMTMLAGLMALVAAARRSRTRFWTCAA